MPEPTQDEMKQRRIDHVVILHNIAQGLFDSLPNLTPDKTRDIISNYENIIKLLLDFE